MQQQAEDVVQCQLPVGEQFISEPQYTRNGKYPFTLGSLTWFLAQVPCCPLVSYPPIFELGRKANPLPWSGLDAPLTAGKNGGEIGISAKGSRT